jgi:phage gpG-like protein
MPSPDSLMPKVPKEWTSEYGLDIPHMYKLGIKLGKANPDNAFDSIENEIINRAAKVSDYIIQKLGEALDAAMKSSIWAWENGTRDIIDTGKLMSSRKIIMNGNTIEISYDVPYFGIVHFGGYIVPYGNVNAQKVYVPARPWITSTLEGNGPIQQFDFGKAYQEALDRI